VRQVKKLAGTKWSDHRGRRWGTKNLQVNFSLRRRNGVALLGTRLRVHSRRCAFPCRAHPFPLQWQAPLRVIPLTQARPQDCQLWNRRAPRRVHIRIAVCSPPHARPSAAASDPAEGYFTRTNPSVSVPGGISPTKWCVQVHISAFFHCIARTCARATSRFRFRVRIFRGIYKYIIFGLK
jgi:hypothetical protein